MEIQITSDSSAAGGQGRRETNHIIYSREDNYVPATVPSDDDFMPPINIVTQEFQKVKKTVTAGKKVNIKMSNNDYLCFTAKDSMCPPKVEFGDYSATAITYSSDFYSSTIGGLIKIPGLSNQMKVSAPRSVENSPIKIKVDACLSGFTLGTVEIYVNNVDKIDDEMRKRDDQNSRMAAPPTRRKRATRS